MNEPQEKSAVLAPVAPGEGALPGRWNPIYTANVLAPDYAFAAAHLAPHFCDALIAHARTLKKRLPEKAEALWALERALMDLRAEALPPYSPLQEDIFFIIMEKLEARLGKDAAGYLRLGLSRNDLDMTVYRMHARTELLKLARQLKQLRGVLLKLARAHVDTVMVAHTHHQPAQPTSLAHYLAAVENVLARDHARIMNAFSRLNQSPMGAAALAGSSHGLDRHYTSELLGFDGPIENTYDAVASGDWQVEGVGVVQTCATTLSRFTHDLLLWASAGMLSLADGLVQGSSIMPQKRNPVALEHARARFSKAIGHAQAVVTSNHNIPFGDVNDPGPDVQAALATVYAELGSGLNLLTTSLSSCDFCASAWRKLTRETETTATELADELARTQNLAFGDAHRLVAGLIERLRARGACLQDAGPGDLKALGGPELSPQALKDALDPEAFMNRRDGFGGPAPVRMKAHLDWASHRLKAGEEEIHALASNLERAREMLGAPRKEEQ